MWWSIVTLTTVGYGDIVPISPIGKIISAITAVMGVASIALVTGILGAGFTKRMEYKKAALTEAIAVALEDGHISQKEGGLARASLKTRPRRRESRGSLRNGPPRESHFLADKSHAPGVYTTVARTVDLLGCTRA